MNRYYYAGLPYSDELYHHGIIGQKWGVRRFQNADGTWTAAGKERYGSGKAKEVGEKVKSGAKKFISAVGGETKKAAKAVGNASKRATKYAVKRFKMKHPSFASDEELMEFKRRVDLERSYKDAKRDLASRKLGNRFLATVGDITKKSVSTYADTLSRSAANKLASKLTESKEDKKLRKRQEEMSNKILDIKNEIANDAEANRIDRNHVNALDSDNEGLKQRIAVARMNQASATDAETKNRYASIIKSYGEEINKNDRAKAALNRRIKSRSDSVNERRNILNNLDKKGDNK